MRTIGSTLKREIELYAKSIAQSNQLFLAAASGALTPQHVELYVRGILFLIRGTMDVLRRAERRALAAGDRELAEHYRHKIHEEQGHDRWAERDLEHLPSSGAEYGRNHSTTALGELLAYLNGVVDQDPYLFLSYILWAEYSTVLLGPDWLQAIESKCGVPQSQITVVANHVELDREHTAEGVREIDALVTSQDKEVPMLEVLRRSICHFEKFTNEILSAESKAA
jgi:hypothetical protein